MKIVMVLLTPHWTCAHPRPQALSSGNCGTNCKTLAAQVLAKPSGGRVCAEAMGELSRNGIRCLV